MDARPPERPGASWAGTHAYRARALHRPSSLDELQRLVAASERMRALGTRHSFNGLADSAGDLVSVADLPGGIELDRAAGVAEVPAGWRYGVVARALEAEGLALHNLGSLPHISVAGAIATATHGSGARLQGLAGAVRGLQLVTAAGDVLELGADDPRLPGAAVGLGALGIVTRVRLATQPTYLVRQDVWTGLPWGALAADPMRILEAGTSVSVFLHWGAETASQVWVKQRLADGDDPEDATLAPAEATLAAVGATRSLVSGWNPLLASPLPPSVAGDATAQAGRAAPWLERLPHFRLDGTPSAGDEIQSEWFVDRADAAAALAAVRALAPRIDPLLLVTELRTVAADDLWLSTASGRDSLAIHFTWRNDPEAVAALLPAIEDALAPFRARPHWGKWWATPPDRFPALYPRLDDFRALRDELDPGRKLGNELLDRILGA